MMGAMLELGKPPSGPGAGLRFCIHLQQMMKSDELAGLVLLSQCICSRSIVFVSFWVLFPHCQKDFVLHVEYCRIMQRCETNGVCDRCCHHERLGCPEDIFDCHAGLKDWRHGWSKAQNLSCTSAGPTYSYILFYHVLSVLHFCFALFCGLSGKAKKEWCCESLHRGCEWGAKHKHGLSDLVGSVSQAPVTTEETRYQIEPTQRTIPELSLIRIDYWAFESPVQFAFLNWSHQLL